MVMIMMGIEVCVRVCVDGWDTRRWVNKSINPPSCAMGVRGEKWCALSSFVYTGRREGRGIRSFRSYKTLLLEHTLGPV